MTFDPMNEPLAPPPTFGPEGSDERRRVRWWQTEHHTLSDGEVIDVTWWNRVCANRRIMRVQNWWYYSVRRFPKPPPLDKDPVARHFGFVDGVPACKGPICQEHEWKVTDA